MRGKNNCLKKINILVFQKSGFIGGAEKNLQRWIAYFREKFDVSVTLCGPGKGPFFDYMASIGVKTFQVDLPDWRKGKNFFKRYFIRSKIENSFKSSNHFDLIFSNDFFYSPYAVHLGKKLNTPVIIHIQSDCEPKRIHQYSLDHADKVIITTKSTYQKINPFFKPNVLEIIPYGVVYPAKTTSTDQRFKFDQENMILGVAANLLPHKGLEFIFSLADYLKSTPGWEIHWVGGDPQSLLQKLKSKVNQLNLDNRIFFHGFIDDMSSFYNSIHCLIHPAQYEPFGIVLIEAMSHGIPIISTKTNGGIEVLSDIEKGYWLVEINGVIEMGEKIKKIIQMKKEFGVVGEKFKEKFEKEYLFSNSMNKMEAVFMKTLSCI